MRGTFTQLLCAAVLGLTLSGCAQNEGERCEVDSDCAAGLVCDLRGGLNTGVCQVSGSGPIDAAVTPRDGSVSDAPAPAADAGADVSVVLDMSVASDAPADVTADSRPDVTAPPADGAAGN
jgi:hypothetical protein